jgi:uridine nucleosidase
MNDHSNHHFVDDSMAILSAFNSPEVEVIGLTSLFGNVPTTMATNNARYLTHLAGRPEVPVVEGAHTSIRGVAKERIADFVHGSDGFGNTIGPTNNAKPADQHSQSAAEFIVQQAIKYPGQVTVLALASLTNLALALQLDPCLPQKLGRVVALGGAFQTSGNVNPAAEANVFGDPDAANVVFSRMTNCYLLGLDVTHSCIMTAEAIEGIKGKGRHGSFLHSITQFYLDYHRKMYAMDAVYVHDAAALAAVIAPHLFDWHHGKVLVVADGPAKGKTILDECKREWIGHNGWTDLPQINVALGVQSTALVSWVLDRMTRG